MGNFSNNAITDVGKMLLADVQAGAIFTPTRIVMGSGSMPSGTTTAGMTNVITPVKSLTINKKKRTPDGKCIFGGVYTNEEVTSAFYFRELALYAKAVYLNEDGSVKSEGAETLYSYGNAGATADYMPAYSTSTVVEKQMDLVTWVGNDAQVDLTIESGVYMSREAFDSHAARHAMGGEDPITPKSIGAAPAGLIYGYYEITTWAQIEANLRSIIEGLKSWEKNRFIFYVTVFDLEIPSGHWFVEVEKKYSVDAYITITNDVYTIKMYYNGSAFDEMMWVSPPFYTGKEYRTTEQRQGKTVYKKLDTDGVLKYRLDGETAWYPYAQAVGAAPVGYGLGSYPQKTLSLNDLNSTFATGWYWVSQPGSVINGVSFNYANLLVHGFSLSACVQELRILATNTVLKRFCHQNVWGEWEVENPPLLTGVEYRTTERYKGVAVYKKVDTAGNILWRPENETTWRILAAASNVAPASVQ